MFRGTAAHLAIENAANDGRVFSLAGSYECMTRFRVVIFFILSLHGGLEIMFHAIPVPLTLAELTLMYQVVTLDRHSLDQERSHVS